MNEINPDNAQCLLLADMVFIEHADMDHDLAGAALTLCLELNSHPAMALVSAMKISSSDRIGENKEIGALPSCGSKALKKQVKLVVEHSLEPLAGDIARRRAVDGIADGHIVRRDGLRDGPRSAAHLKEPAHHFLTRTNLRESAVEAGIEIDCQCFLMRIGAATVYFRIHMFSFGMVEP